MPKSQPKHPGFGERLKRLRATCGSHRTRTSLRTFAQELGVEFGAYRWWESHDRFPGHEVVVRALARLPMVKKPELLAAWVERGDGQLEELLALDGESPLERAGSPDLEATILNGIRDHIVEPAEATITIRVLRRLGLATVAFMLALGMAAQSEASTEGEGFEPPETCASLVFKANADDDAELDDEESGRRRKAARRAVRRSKPVASTASMSRIDDQESAPFGPTLQATG